MIEKRKTIAEKAKEQRLRERKDFELKRKLLGIPNRENEIDRTHSIVNQLRVNTREGREITDRFRDALYSAGFDDRDILEIQANSLRGTGRFEAFMEQNPGALNNIPVRIRRIQTPYTIPQGARGARGFLSNSAKAVGGAGG